MSVTGVSPQAIAGFCGEFIQKLAGQNTMTANVNIHIKAECSVGAKAAEKAF